MCVWALLHDHGTISDSYYKLEVCGCDQIPGMGDSRQTMSALLSTDWGGKSPGRTAIDAIHL